MSLMNVTLSGCHVAVVYIDDGVGVGPVARNCDVSDEEKRGSWRPLVVMKFPLPWSVLHSVEVLPVQVTVSAT